MQCDALNSKMSLKLECRYLCHLLSSALAATGRLWGSRCLPLTFSETVPYSMLLSESGKPDGGEGKAIGTQSPIIPLSDRP